MLRLAVLVSGGGTNLQAILDAIDEGIITNAEVSVVISNNAGAYALERAKKKEIDAVCLSPKTFASREAFNEALLAETAVVQRRSRCARRMPGCDPAEHCGCLSE